LNNHLNKDIIKFKDDQFVIDA